jgi:peptidoglycan L-alanyl-D-glutamate endopeptidase CwlK
MILSANSLKKLETCHPELVTVFNLAAQKLPMVIVCGHRTQEEQDAAFASGHSQVKWPSGKHNADPSNAVDFAPLNPDGTIAWKDEERFIYYAGVIMGIAQGLGYSLRSGCDWDSDGQLADNTFPDLGHIERAV